MQMPCIELSGELTYLTARSDALPNTCLCNPAEGTIFLVPVEHHDIVDDTKFSQLWVFAQPPVVFGDRFLIFRRNSVGLSRASFARRTIAS